MSAVPVVELAGLSREDWLAERRKGIGSSDVAAICGHSSWGSPLSVWLDKTGQADDEPESERMEMGRWLEDACAGKFASDTGLVVQKPTHMYQSSEHSFMRANPDRFVGEKGAPKVTALLECKSAGLGGTDAWDEGPPQGVVLQATHQGIVCGVETVYVGVILLGSKFRYWPVVLDPQVVEPLIEIERDFWSLVEAREAPPADGHPATSEALSQLYKQVEPEATVALDEFRDSLQRLREVKAREKDIAAERAEIENLVKQAMGPAEVGLFAGSPIVTWKASSAFDHDRLAMDDPDAYAQFRKSGVDLDRLKKDRPDLYSKYRTEHTGARRFLFKGGKS